MFRAQTVVTKLLHVTLLVDQDDVGAVPLYERNDFFRSGIALSRYAPGAEREAAYSKHAGRAAPCVCVSRPFVVHPR
jgi:hypothetical protein